MPPVADMTPVPPTNAMAGERIDPAEAQARAMLAAALIIRGAVAVPSGGAHMLDADRLRLRELTDDLYRVLTRPAVKSSEPS